MNLFSQQSQTSGWIEVIVGCMYSGKTEELIRQIRRAEIAKLPHQLFKPQIDDRYSKTEVSSHNRNMEPSTVISSPLEIFDHIKDEVKVVGIDEGQFFSMDLILVANELANNGKRVIVAGLDTDWKGFPFGPIPHLMAVAEIVNKQHAICVECGAPATRTQRLPEINGDDILVGSDGIYEARCRNHFDATINIDTVLTNSKKPGKNKPSTFADL